MSRTPIAVLCLALLLAAGCTASDGGDGDGRDDAEAAVDRLAAALSEHTLAEVPLVDSGAVEEYAELVSPLDGEDVDVTVEEVSADGSTAEARLGWTWDLAGGGWSYTSTSELIRVEGAWLVDWSPATLEPSLTPEDRLGLFTRPAERGRVLGADDEPIVVERPVQRFGVDKSRIVPAQQRASARQVARAVGVDVPPYVREVVAAGDDAFVEAIVLRAGEARELLTAAYGETPGAVVIGDEIPLAPTREFAAPVLGRVGPATAELVADSNGRIEAGDEVGLSGLQLRYDEELTGTGGVEVVAANASDQRRTLFATEPVPGDDLRTGLDVDLQTAAEATLADVTGSPSALVAVRPSDGQVLAAASGPGSEGLNTATDGRFAPGSTFKVVSTLALLRAGVAPGDELACPATLDVDGRDFGNYDDYPAGGTGRISLRTALANSCNTAFIGARDRLGDDDLAAAAAALGMGVDADVGFPAYFGEVPPADGETDRAASMIGQGRVSASPLVMATVAASVGAGRTVVPRLLPDVEVAGEQAPEVPLTRAEGRALRDLMGAVVTEGSGSVLADVGADGAKTGTAEYGEPDASGELPTHAWMIALRGDLAVAAFVEDGDSGSATAGPILADFLDAAPRGAR